MAEAHAALAERELFLEWDRDGAEREYKRALELNPSEQLANLEYPDILLIEGRTEEAIAQGRSSLSLDPLSPRAGKALSWILYYAGKYDDAIEQCKKTQELFPNYREINLGPDYEKKGLYDQAINEYLASEARWGLPEHDVATLRQTYASSGWRAYWKKLLELRQEESKRNRVASMEFAGVYLHLGDNDLAIKWLQKAFEQHELALITLSIDPQWESLRSDVRFRELLRNIGLPT